MNLVSSNILISPVFSRLWKFESVVYKGEISPKLLHYEGVHEGTTFQVFSTILIRKEEKFMWESVKELLEHTFKLAAAGVQGFYGFDTLTIDLTRDLKDYRWADLSQLIMNHARKLAVGESRLIQYGSIFGILKKRVSELWGKIDLKLPVEIFSKEDATFDLYLKKLLRETEKTPEPKVFVILDLSTGPLFKFGHEKQTERIAAFLEKEKQSRETLSEMYYVQGSRVTEILQQFDPA